MRYGGLNGLGELIKIVLTNRFEQNGAEVIIECFVLIDDVPAGFELSRIVDQLARIALVEIGSGQKAGEWNGRLLNYADGRSGKSRG